MSDESAIRVLIVEDDEAFRRVLEMRIGAEGYSVATAADGRDGMKAIVTFDPHLVLSDWMMPHVDGLELCQSIKTGLKELAPYFILLTAKGEVSDRVLALGTGADDYVVKPCDAVEILARVRSGARIVTLERAQRLREEQLEVLRAQVVKLEAETERLRNELPTCPHCGSARAAA